MDEKNIIKWDARHIVNIEQTETEYALVVLNRPILFTSDNFQRLWNNGMWKFILTILIEFSSEILFNKLTFFCLKRQSVSWLMVVQMSGLILSLKMNWINLSSRQNFPLVTWTPLQMIRFNDWMQWNANEFMRLIKMKLIAQNQFYRYDHILEHKRFDILFFD